PARPHRPVRVAVLARRAGMSRRNFDRRFREITGTAALTWLTHQRVLRAQQLLETTRLPVGEVGPRGGVALDPAAPARASGPPVRVLLVRRPALALQAGHRDRPGRLPGHVRPPS